MKKIVILIMVLGLFTGLYATNSYVVSTYAFNGNAAADTLPKPKQQQQPARQTKPKQVKPATVPGQPDDTNRRVPPVLPTPPATPAPMPVTPIPTRPPMV